MTIGKGRGAHRWQRRTPPRSATVGAGGAAVLGVVAGLSVLAELVPPWVAVVIAVVVAVLTVAGQLALASHQKTSDPSAIAERHGRWWRRKSVLAGTVVVMLAAATALFVSLRPDKDHEPGVKGATQPLSIMLPVSLPAQEPPEPPRLTVADEALYLYGESQGASVLAAFSVLDGRSRWSARLPGRPDGDPLVVPAGNVVLTQIHGRSKTLVAAYRRSDGKQLWTRTDLDARLINEELDKYPPGGPSYPFGVGYTSGPYLSTLHQTAECCATAVIVDTRTGKTVLTAGKDNDALLLPQSTATAGRPQRALEWNRFAFRSYATTTILARDVATGRKLARRTISTGADLFLADTDLIRSHSSGSDGEQVTVASMSTTDLTDRWSWTSPAVGRADKDEPNGGISELIPCGSHIVCVHYAFQTRTEHIERVVGLDLRTGRQLWIRPDLSSIISVPGSNELAVLGVSDGSPSPSKRANSHIIVNTVSGSTVGNLGKYVFPLDASTVVTLRSSGPSKLIEALSVDSVRLTDGNVTRVGVVNSRAELCRVVMKILVCPTEGNSIQLWSFRSSN